jgi:hypothetical protein
MSHSVVRLLKHDAPKLMRWAVLILPLLFCGCFDTQPTTGQSAKAKEIGIASVSRFFMYGQDGPSPKLAEEVIAPVFPAYSHGILAVPELAEDISENRIAIPAFIGAGQNGRENHAGTGYASRVAVGNIGHERGSSFRNAASLVFNTPFELVFSRVFNQNKTDDLAQTLSHDLTQTLKDELPNPFTEARLKQESSVDQEASDVKSIVTEDKADSTKPTAEKNSNTQDNATADSGNPQTPTPPAGASASERFLIIGDFDGSGTLKAKSAQRSSDTRFISEDGARDFNLYINSAAVQDRRAFYIDDINLDEIPDILVTSANALFGAVLLGNGAGGYHVADTFVTGYMPTVPCAGPVRNGRREILAVGMTKIGFLRTFSYNGKYLLQQTEPLSFAPGYLLHLVAPETSLHYLRMAQKQGTEQIWGWSDDGALKVTADQLGADPGVLSGDFGSYSMQAYQVGDYASVVLTSQDRSFNVANMRLLPRSFIVIGDLRRRGNLDVAVADLELFEPTQSSR